MYMYVHNAMYALKQVKLTCFCYNAYLLITLLSKDKHNNFNVCTMR